MSSFSLRALSGSFMSAVQKASDGAVSFKSGCDSHMRGSILRNSFNNVVFLLRRQQHQRLFSLPSFHSYFALILSVLRTFIELTEVSVISFFFYIRCCVLLIYSGVSVST